MSKFLLIFFRKATQTIYWLLLPGRLRARTEIMRQPKKIKNTRIQIINYLTSILQQPAFDKSGEYQEVLDYLKKNPLEVFPYPFSKEFPFISIPVHLDVRLDLKFTIFNGKRLYFKRRWHEEQIKKCMSGLLIEQHPDSPHRYLHDNFNLGTGAIVADVGAAEGIFTLENIEKIGHAYLFESDPEWIEPLAATFSPWKDKVTIINRKVGSKNAEDETTLDSSVPWPIDFLKVDVEGSDKEILAGAEKKFENKTIHRVAICCYHQANDEQTLRDYLERLGLNTSVSRGFMIFLHDPKLGPPFLRRGLLRATLM